jgi:hypothetical protein
MSITSRVHRAIEKDILLVESSRCCRNYILCGCEGLSCDLLKGLAVRMAGQVRPARFDLHAEHAAGLRDQAWVLTVARPAAKSFRPVEEKLLCGSAEPK